MSTDAPPPRRAAPDLERCLARVAAGDALALRTLYVQTSPALFALALRFMTHRDAAEDVLQEVYLAVWRKAAHFDPHKGDAMTWLRVLLRSRALDALRRRTAAQASELPDLSRLVDPAASPLALVEDHATRIQLQAGLGVLQARHARALRCIYFEGLSFPQLARREQVPVATAKSWVRRALLQMRRSGRFDDQALAS